MKIATIPRWLTTLVICAVIVLGAWLLIYWISATEPTAEQSTAVRKSAALVETVEVQKGTYRPTISALGTVEAAQDVNLSPRVGGEVVAMADSFAPGETVDKGEVLVRIDPADYRNALVLSQSALRQVRAEFEIEKGRREVAEQELELFEENMQISDRSLILREPQLESIKAQVEAAEADVEQARLNLERTEIRAPFDAKILSRNVNVGSQVAAGETCGRLVGLDEYWVIVTVPLSKVYWVAFAERGEERPSTVRLRNRAAWPEGVYRQGRVERLIGSLEEGTRLARILVTVPNPLAGGLDSRTDPPLVIGAVLQAEIECRPLEDVVRLSRDYIRDNGTVWVNDGEELRIREVEVVFEDADYAYLESGLRSGDAIVTTNLRTAAEGLALRTESSEGTTLAGSPSEAEDASSGDEM